MLISFVFSSDLSTFRQPSDFSGFDHIFFSICSSGSGDVLRNEPVVSEISKSGGRTGGDIMWNGAVVSETIESGCPTGGESGATGQWC